MACLSLIFFISQSFQVVSYLWKKMPFIIAIVNKEVEHSHPLIPVIRIQLLHIDDSMSIPVTATSYHCCMP